MTCVEMEAKKKRLQLKVIGKTYDTEDCFWRIICCDRNACRVEEVAYKFYGTGMGFYICNGYNG